MRRLIELPVDVKFRIIAGKIRVKGYNQMRVRFLIDFTRLIHIFMLVAKSQSAFGTRIVLEIDEALTRDLEESVRAGALDLILASGRVSGYNLLTHSLGTVDFRWMASPVLGIPTNRPLSPQELQHWPVIALSPKSYHHTRIEDWFRAGNGYCNRL